MKCLLLPHPSSETNLLSPRTSWLTKVIRLRPRLRLYPLSGQMQWHKGGPDAPLSSCWPLSLLQSLRKGPKVEKVLGTGHIAALITHSVTIEPNVLPPPFGLNSFLTSRESNGASVAHLPPTNQDSSSVLSSSALTAAKCYSPASLCSRITPRGEELELIEGMRQWVRGRTLHPIKGFLLVILCKRRGFFWNIIY